MTTPNGLSGRPFVSLLTTFSFIIATISGIVLYVSPQGRIAFWQSWTMLGLGKAQWSNLHTLASFLFAITSLFHLGLNWRSFVGYLHSQVGETLRYRRELTAASAVMILFVGSALYGLAPLNRVLLFGERLKSSWAKGGDNEPPFPHAELLTLKGLTTRQGIDTGTALNCLERQGIRVRSEQETLQVIARNNGVPPSEIYARIRTLSVMVQGTANPIKSPLLSTATKFSASVKPQLAHAADVPLVTVPVLSKEVERYTEDSVVIKFEGTGVGKKSVEQICREFSIPLATAQRKLAATGLKVSPDETLKEAAKRAGLVPIEVLQVILVGEPALK